MLKDTEGAGGDKNRETPKTRADTTPELPEPGHAMTIMDLFDAGWGLHIVPVTAPEGVISPSSTLHAKSLGKAPGRLTQAGWTSLDLNSPKFRCHDRATGEMWRDKWGANAGFVVGDGYIAFDNDEGEALDRIIVQVCLEVLGPKVDLLRRFVRDPGHRRSAFLLRVMDLDSNSPVTVGNQTLKFEYNGAKAELQVLAHNKQLVVAGVHPGTGAAYVLSRRVSSLADIPLASPDQFDRIIERVAAGMQALGWAVRKTGAAKAAPGARPEPSPGAEAVNIGDFEEVVWILERLPNRDAPPGARTHWDEFLDDYDEYIKVLYAICGALGDTPEVKALAMGWANGRVQIKQSAESAWASIVNGNPGLSMYHLRQHAWRFIRKEYVSRQFPDLSPEEQAEIKHAEKAARMTAWDRLQEALRWPGMDAALAGNANIARNQFGFAQIGKGASNALPMTRPWITDRHARGYVSVLSGMPASTKTLKAVAYAHAIVTERSALAGVSRIERPGSVVILALDNELSEEFDLKGRALRKHHGLNPPDFKHAIHVVDNCGPLVERQPNGDIIPSRRIIELGPELAWLREHEELSLIVIDALLGAAGGGDTADGPTMSAIMRVCKELATRLHCSVDIINHITKGGAARDPNGMDAVLGARALSATARFMTNLKKEGTYTYATPGEEIVSWPDGKPGLRVQVCRHHICRQGKPCHHADPKRSGSCPGKRQLCAGVRRRRRAPSALGGAQPREKN
jgi:hypothetical protein